MTFLNAGPTIPILLVVALAFTHWVADFLLQSNWMALGKSKKLLPLLIHCLVYSACFLWMGLAFAGITFVLHVVTDFVTSRVNSKLWFVSLKYRASEPIDDSDPSQEAYLHFDDSRRHWFFVSIGFGQFVHAACLLGTYWFLFGGSL